jgi:thiol-disulfide isomerase/thioredoxin
MSLPYELKLVMQEVSDKMTKIAYLNGLKDGKLAAERKMKKMIDVAYEQGVDAGREIGAAEYAKSRKYHVDGGDFDDDEEVTAEVDFEGKEGGGEEEEDDGYDGHGDKAEKDPVLISEPLSVVNKSDVMKWVKKNPDTMILYYGSWCPPCKAAKLKMGIPEPEGDPIVDPSFSIDNAHNRIMRILANQRNGKLWLVESKRIGDGLNVESFPTIREYVNGKVKPKTQGISTQRMAKMKEIIADVRSSLGA